MSGIQGITAKGLIKSTKNTGYLSELTQIIVNDRNGNIITSVSKKDEMIRIAISIDDDELDTEVHSMVMPDKIVLGLETMAKALLEIFKEDQSL